MKSYPGSSNLLNYPFIYQQTKLDLFCYCPQPVRFDTPTSRCVLLFSSTKQLVLSGLIRWGAINLVVICAHVGAINGKDPKSVKASRLNSISEKCKPHSFQKNLCHKNVKSRKEQNTVDIIPKPTNGASDGQVHFWFHIWLLHGTLYLHYFDFHHELGRIRRQKECSSSSICKLVY